MEGFYNAFFSDCLFVVVCAFLAATIVSGESAPASRSASFSGLVILRHLAVPVGSVVGSRALRMMLALVLNVAAVFFADVHAHRSRGAWCDLPLVLRGLDRLRSHGIGVVAPPRTYGRG